MSLRSRPDPPRGIFVEMLYIASERLESIEIKKVSALARSQSPAAQSVKDNDDAIA
jgi:hypothetical protein